jgi:hypothetical protein
LLQVPGHQKYTRFRASLTSAVFETRYTAELCLNSNKMLPFLALPQKTAARKHRAHADQVSQQQKQRLRIELLS